MLLQRLHHKKQPNTEQQRFVRDVEILRAHDWSDPPVENWVTCVLEDPVNRYGASSPSRRIRCCEYLETACR